MKLSVILVFIILLSGCCHLPLVDCGPKIEQLKATPTKIRLANDKEIEIGAWQYDSRANGLPVLLHLDFNVLRLDSMMIENASIKIVDHVQQQFPKVDL